MARTYWLYIGLYIYAWNPNLHVDRRPYMLDLYATHSNYLQESVSGTLGRIGHNIQCTSSSQTVAQDLKILILRKYVLRRVSEWWFNAVSATEA